MGKIYLLIFLGFIYSCSFKQSDICESNKKVSDDVIFCFPKINGFEEVLDNEEVQNYLIKFNPPQNEILAYYTTQDKLDNLNLNKELPFDNYILVSSPKKWLEIKSDVKVLENFSSMISNSFLKEKWSSIKDMYKNSDLLDLPSTPNIIESYSIREGVKSFLVIMKYKKGDKFIPLLMCTNLILIKDKIIGVNYYEKYDSEESIKKIKKKNKIIVNDIQKANI